MSSFGESLIFAALMTLAEELEEQKNLRQKNDTNYDIQTFSHYDEESAKRIAIKQYKEKAVALFDNMIKEADRKSDTFSDLGATELIDMLLEAVFFFSIDSEYRSETNKAKAIEYSTKLADIKGFCSESGGNYIFDSAEQVEIIDVFSKCINAGTSLVCQGSITSEIPDCLTDIVTAMCELLSGIELSLDIKIPSNGWNGKKMGLFFINKTKQSIIDMMNQKWESMSADERRETDYKRWFNEKHTEDPDIIKTNREGETAIKKEEDLQKPISESNKDWGYLLMNEYDDSRTSINDKLKKCFDGRIVRKDLTKKIKEGANVPVYVLEFLLGQYCSSDDEAVIEDGLKTVKRILADNYVRPDEAQKIMSLLRQRGSYTVIDKLTVHLNIKTDTYEAEFSNLGLKNIPIAESYPSKYDRLLCGGIWCIVGLDYEYIEEEKNACPIQIRKLTPIQMPHIDINELKDGRKAFTKDEWISVLLRSTGMEPDRLSEREKWLLLARMIPLVENNYNLCELGPRSTGKSHIYKEVSPNSILVSGGQTTVANLFYHMGRKTVGLVGVWDCVAFDEVAGISFKDKDGIQIMKDYMNSGSFSRGKDEINASASMAFVGNINQSVDVLLKTSSLFAPFPPEMGTDTAFLDRIHCYVPGWEIPKFRPEHFTNDYGFITDYLAEFIRELRKEQYGDVIEKYFRLGTNLNQRDTVAVRKTVGGMVKLLYPDGNFTKEQIEEILVFALEMRRRVKEQLKKLGGMEFYDVNFSYIDNVNFEEHFVSVPEQGGGKLIPEGMCNPGQVYTISPSHSGMIGVFRLESQMLPGTGKLERTGIGSDSKSKEAANTAFNYLKANSNRISASISTTTKNYIVNYQDLQGIGMTDKLALPTLIAICSIALGKPTVSSLAVLGEISIAGTLIKVSELANTLQVCLDSGAKKILLPITSAADLATVPADLIGCFNLIFYQSPEDAVFKALGVE